MSENRVLTIAPNNDKMLHLTSNRTIKFAKLWVPSFCPFYTFVHCAETMQLRFSSASLNNWCRFNMFNVLYHVVLHKEILTQYQFNFISTKNIESNMKWAFFFCSLITICATRKKQQQQKITHIKIQIDKNFTGLWF